jgi:carbon monoxide dehydrogenase subunit G
MELIGQQRIAAPIDQTWAALNDPDTLKACIAGCETIDKVSDNEYAMAIAVRIGPVNAKFKGKLRLENIEPPHAYTIVFEGQGGVAGFGKGSADVRLTATDGATLLDYAARAQVGGKIAQIGSRLVDSAAKKMADDFFAAFNVKVGGGTADGLPQTSAEAAGTGGGTAAAVHTADMTATGGIPAWIWALGASVVLAVLAYFVR